MEEEENRHPDDPARSPAEDRNGDDVIGSPAMRPIFLGNLNINYTAADVSEIFERPMLPPDCQDSYSPMPVDRVDLKRGYCFIFLKDVQTQQDKETAEKFVSVINGMAIPNVTNALRAEFARGDGHVKRKEDDRRKRIQPSETLFVVNFHEETTRREDLQMLFEPFGELVRIDMKRNYAFVQFRTIEEATRAKEVTNGGKLDQSVLTVEFVARQRGEADRRRDRDRDRGRYSDRRRPPPPPMGGDYRRGRDDRHYDDPRPDDYRRRSPPPRDRYDSGYRRRSRSRSRSPPRYRSRSPPRRDYYDDDRRGGSRDGRGGSRDGHRDSRGRSPDAYRRRSPDRDYRGGDRGYRA